LSTRAIVVLAALSSAVVCGTASAEKWLKIDPSDPFQGEKGNFHLFDVDSAFEDRGTGFVAAHMIYKPPAEVAAGGESSRMLWAFNCNTNEVHYVADLADGVATAKQGWRSEAHSLAEPVMGGVTNMFGRKLCALKGSWPLGDLPSDPKAPASK
jgi:hypothetical protein